MANNGQSWCRAGGNLRPKWKCLCIPGSLLMLLLLYVVQVAQVTCRPQDEVSDSSFHVGGGYPAADNVELHRVKLVNGVVQKEHPIIMYKEDFVSADYDPSENAEKADHNDTQKYTDISQRRRSRLERNETEQYRALKPEKIYFDVLRETPLFVIDDAESADTKYGARRTRIKLIPLIDDFANDQEGGRSDETPSKDSLSKRPKKFHRRTRRSASDPTDHRVQKRNPYYRQQSLQTYVDPGDRSYGEIQTRSQYIYVKRPVPGKKWNALDIPVTKEPPTPISFENRIAADENDRVVFSSGPRRTTRRPVPTRRPPESLFRDPNPENYDFSFMHPGSQRPTSAPRLPTASAPTTRPPQPAASNMNTQFAAPTPTTGVSRCVWAIVNCCTSRDSTIRYSCFEQNGCYGAFWGLNPCADDVRENFINYVSDYYD